MRRLLCGAVLAGALLFAPSAVAGGFGLQGFEVAAVNQDGSPDVQAGSHPYALVTSFSLDESGYDAVAQNYFASEGLKDVQVQLPPGFVGNPTAVPRCSYTDFLAVACPDDTAVGEATTGVAESKAYISPRTHKRLDTVTYLTNPVYNVEPQRGVAAEFGVLVKGFYPVLIEASVRTGADYGITVGSHNITEAVIVASEKVTVWGVPGEASHDALRGKCLEEAESTNEQAEYGSPHNEEKSRCPDPELEAPGALPTRPFLTNPTSCGEAREATIGVDGWDRPGNFATGEGVLSLSDGLPPLTGCEKLDFSPSLTVSPDGSAASTPTGLNVGVHVSQESTSNPLGLGEADVKDTTVVLPAGVQTSPSAADGLQSCSLSQIGFTGVSPVTGTDQFTPDAPSCPDASKVANVRIKTPLLEHELTGSVFLASPQNFAGPLENPFGSLFALYLVAEEPEAGVLVKLPGRVSLNEATGQLTSTFEDTPQLPFSDLELEFYGTDRAPLATPAYCGTYTTTSVFTPWSAASTPGPEEVKEPSASFTIDSGPDGSACPGSSLPFNPSLTAGSTNVQAGAFSAFTMTMGRPDGQQSMQAVQLHVPPGLSGVLTGVRLCPEAQANAGTCSPESLIGETTVSVGLGNDPFTVTGGKVYLTEGYEGAPFGLSIVNPAQAGPFVLQEGRPVVVRAKIEIDPHTAALTVTSATGGRGIPTMIDGVPLQVKHVNVTVNRSGFTFNPTSCNATNVAATVQSAEGASAPVSVPFQVTNCAGLKFTPQFVVSTSGKTSKADGASLTTKVIEPSEPFGGQANIARVKVELPKQLPSRLTTLQKACTQAQFQANPAGCPAASVIGHATVHTPLLPVPLEGPAYFVSNGGEAFPNLIMVLQGYGVTIDLVGDTFISKAGITSTTFKAVPDQPFNAFELTLPEGPYSALAANGNLCALTRTVLVKKKVTVRVKGHKRTVTRTVKTTQPESLTLPNEFVSQDGAVTHQSTKVTVTGCTKAKSAAKTQSGKKKHARTTGKAKAKGQKHKQ